MCTNLTPVNYFALQSSNEGFVGMFGCMEKIWAFDPYRLEQ